MNLNVYCENVLNFYISEVDPVYLLLKSASNKNVTTERQSRSASVHGASIVRGSLV